MARLTLKTGAANAAPNPRHKARYCAPSERNTRPRVGPTARAGCPQNASPTQPLAQRKEVLQMQTQTQNAAGGKSPVVGAVVAAANAKTAPAKNATNGNGKATTAHAKAMQKANAKLAGKAKKTAPANAKNGAAKAAPKAKAKATIPTLGQYAQGVAANALAAYNEGLQMCAHGKPNKANPYSPKSEPAKWAAWSCGWVACCGAYNTGTRAHAAGIEQAHNPYPKGTPLGEAWGRGYVNAKANA